LKINEVARKLQISTRTIRFYEEKGLIHPCKQPSNQYRIFSEQEVWRLQAIIALREAGMNLEDIKLALAQMDSGNQDELLYLLELQRSVMFTHWLELKQVIETTDHMITMLKHNHTLPVEEVYKLAEGSKRLKENREAWNDHWDFDQRALTHDQLVSDNSGKLFRYPHYTESLDQAYRWVAPGSNEFGLDIATGTGNLAGRFVEQGIRMAAIDQSKEMLKQCQLKHPSLQTKLGNFLAIPFLDGQFDFAVSSFAFHHLNAAQQGLALAEMKRVLKPHGRICMTDVMFDNEAKRSAYMLQLQQEGQAESASVLGGDTSSSLPDILAWFDANGYVTKHAAIHEYVYIVLAVPIKAMQ
jgi:putative AdoMet-dependent methyltransferase